MEYTKTPLTREVLTRLVTLVGGDPTQFVRVGDKKFKEAGLELADGAGVRAVVDLLLDHPWAMQRPVVVAGDKAVIARPSDRVLELL
ncbi:MAG: ArsC/Spx/MgsR family protein [Candidatus Binatia bacterium]